MESEVELVVLGRMMCEWSLPRNEHPELQRRECASLKEGERETYREARNQKSELFESQKDCSKSSLFHLYIMVEPITICIAVSIGISALLGLAFGAADLYRNRFKTHIMECYEADDPEYLILWKFLCHPNHVKNPAVKKRDRRRIAPDSDKEKTISDIVRFREDTDLWPEKLYRVWMVHDHEEGRPCIRLFFFTNNAMEYFQDRLFEDKMAATDLILESCSKR